ncbi:MAG: SGNH/GDSL hydrolase family protein [Planctomycetota bacterium]|nr:MAG: SGNH/GDSL hydrolase family protein [Planctomycetota bacterium]
MRSALRSICFALAPAAALLAACELALALLGRDAHSYGVAHGFDPRARYIDADPAQPGAFVTRYYAGEQPEVRVAPRDERTRVVLFGGSNTEGFPHAFLEQCLNDARPSQRPAFEVVNLGRRGYGSARIALLFEQALALAPDICVFYEGHNEFIERGFELELAARGNALERAGIAAAAHLRTFHALVDAWQSDAPDESAAREPALPEKHQWDYDQFRALTYDQTLERLAGFRANAARMCDLARARGARMLLVTAISNDLVAPFASNPPRGTDAASAAALQQRLRAAREQFPARYRGLWPLGPQDRLHQKDWWQPPSPVPSEVAALRLRAPADAGPLFPYWAQPEHWSPKLRAYIALLDAFLRRELSDSERAEVEAAAALVDAILAEYPEHAQALYARATCAYLRGDAAAAARDFRAAARYDCAPRKASDATNGMLRELAGARGVALWDADAWARARMPDGIVGYELMSDECHLHERARRPLMIELARAIAALDARAPDGADAR